MKLFPDSSEVENPQASAFADCQGHGLPAARIPLSAALFWASVVADAAGSMAPILIQSTALPPPFPCRQHPWPAEGVDRPDTPQVLGSGFTASWMPPAGRILSRCPGGGQGMNAWIGPGIKGQTEAQKVDLSQLVAYVGLIRNPPSDGERASASASWWGESWPFPAKHEPDFPV